jgi:NADH pyrophosphatase NudC (nudix superfamily)
MVIFIILLSDKQRNHYTTEEVVMLAEYESGKAHSRSRDEVEDVFWLTTDEIMNHLNTGIILRESIKRAHLLKEKLYTETPQ